MPYVYLIGAMGTGYAKIGRSQSHPRNRVRDMQTANPHELKLLAYTQLDDPEWAEWRLHDKYKYRCVLGEWFTFGWDLVEEFVTHQDVRLCPGCGVFFFQNRVTQETCSRACARRVDSRAPDFVPLDFGRPFR